MTSITTNSGSENKSGSGGTARGFFDLNSAEKSQSPTKRPDWLIPPHEPYWLEVKMENDGELKETYAGDGKNLVLALTVVHGPDEHMNKFFLVHMLVEGNGSVGHTSTVHRNQMAIRSIVESNYGRTPSDKAGELEEALKLSTFGDLNGMRCLAYVASQYANNGNWYNRLGRVITSDMREWPEDIQGKR